MVRNILRPCGVGTVGLLLGLQFYRGLGAIHFWCEIYSFTIMNAQFFKMSGPTHSTMTPGITVDPFDIYPHNFTISNLFTLLLLQCFGVLVFRCFIVLVFWCCDVAVLQCCSVAHCFTI